MAELGNHTYACIHSFWASDLACLLWLTAPPGAPVDGSWMCSWIDPFGLTRVDSHLPLSSTRHITFAVSSAKGLFIYSFTATVTADCELSSQEHFYLYCSCMLEALTDSPGCVPLCCTIDLVDHILVLFIWTWLQHSYFIFDELLSYSI